MEKESFNEINRDITEQEQIKSSSQEVVDRFSSIIPPDKKIVLDYHDKPFKPGGFGRLIKSWDKDNEAVVGIYLPTSQEEIERLKTFDKFLTAHEVSYLFSDFFEQCKGKLSKEEIAESLDSKLDNPAIDSGQNGVITDLIALHLFGDNPQNQKEMAENYLHQIQDYLKEPEIYLRDDIRFLEIGKYLTNEKWIEENISKTIMTQLANRIKQAMSGANSIDQNFFNRYQGFIRYIIQYFRDNFSKSGDIETFLKKALENQ